MRGTPTQIRDQLALTKKSYLLTISPEAMIDLAKFCHAFGNEVAEGNHDRTLRMAGRREAFFHVWEMLKLEPDELIAIYPKIKMQE